MLKYKKEEDAGVVRLTIRMPADLHDKLRWLSFHQRKSQQLVVMEILSKALDTTRIPKEG